MKENYNETDLNGLEIAVIGMAGRFPGARHLDELWENLKKGKESISFFTDEELEGLGVDRALLENPHYVKSNSFLEDKEYFDASFFGYLPNEAEIMDPQIRLFHECAWETLESAGYDPGIYKGLIGVYAGIGPSFHWEALTLLSGRSEILGAFESSQFSSKDYLCTRVSYKLDLKGPSFVVDTACSTSLVTIHLACQGLLNGECDMALAGGVKVTHLRQPGYLYQEGMIMSPDGHCRAFDAKANGTVGGEGIGIALLKRLEDAKNDGDFIHALIKGSAINNDGIRKVGYTAPSVEGQMLVIKAALHMAEVEPETIGYIETHGTGTVLGDPIEIKALKRAFASNKKRFCALGSVKTNIGHLDRAAGVAGFIKAVLALKHRQIPPSLHFEAPNPELGLEDSPFYVNNRPCQWKNDKYPLRAGVSSFGFGGTNAHVVLEEWPGGHSSSAERRAHSAERKEQLILLSAKTETALDKMTKNLEHYLKQNDLNILPDVAYTLQVGRQPFKYRRMTIGANFDETVQTFSAKGENIPVVFMFPGQGSQYVDMASDLYHSEPAFREEMDRCFEILTPVLGYDIKEILYPFNRSNRSYRSNINQTESAQPMIFALEYSLAKLLMKWGIRPHAMIGHSIGEYVAACVSGVFSLEDALLLVAWRGKLMQQMPFGAMLSVPLPENEIKPLLDDQLSLAAVNGVSHCVVSGPEAQVELLAKKLKEDGQNSRLLHTSHAFHSAMMEPVLKAFEGKLEQVRLNEPEIPYISNLTGDWITVEAAANPDYWTGHLRETVRFADGLKELLKEENCVFVEVGPGKALSTFVRQHPGKTTGHWVLNLIKHPKETVKDDYFLLSKVGQLWLYGVHIDWFAFHGAEKRQRIPLPTYPFERQRYWIEGSPFDIGREVLAGRDLGPLLDQPLEYETIEPAVSPVLRQRPELSTSYVAPQNEIEQQLVEVWQSFFGFQPVGTLDDFFELGGDSLKIITVVSRIHKELGVEVPLAELFAHPNIRSIAGYIEKTASKNLYLSIEPVEEKEYYPLTADLLRMYILNELEGVSTAYNLPLAMKIEGRPDKSRFEETFCSLIKRHESLRTSFRMKGEYPVQVIHKEVDFRVRYFDETAGSSWGTDEIKDMARRFSQPFDLAQAPLLRVVLVRLSEKEHLLFLDMHHMISDGISTAVLVREFRDLYMGGELPELRIQYKDFSEWLRCLFETGEIKKQEDYWLECFKGDIPVLDLPTDYPRPAVQSFEGDKIRFSLAEEFSRRLRSFTRESGATLYMVLLAAYDVLLSRYTGQGDIVVGSPVAGRNHTELEHVIGMFLKILVMRNEPSGNKAFNGFLGEVRDTTLTAYENQLYPFRDLVEKIGAGNDLSRNPLFDAMLLVQNIDAPSTDIEGLTFFSYDVNTGFSKVDIFLEAMDTSDGLHLSFEYCTKLFKKNTIERFTGHFVNVLEEVVNNPETRLADIDIMDREEKRQLLEEFNHSGHPPAAEWQKPVHQLFEEQADQTPDRIAVVGDLHQLTYRTYITYLSYKTLNEASNRMARMLRKKGIGADRIVALLMDRSVEMIFAILGILKAGGVYLPIDPEYPKKRILYILEESRATVLLTKEEISKHIPFTSLAGLNSLELEPRVTAKRPQIKDFDSLPLPDRSLVDYEKYHQYIGEALARHTTTIQATRGCPFRCAFCHKIWPKNHVYRSAENIFHEVKTLYDIGARRFMFVDDIFNLQKENCTRFFQLIIKNGLNVQLFFANGLRGDILTSDIIDLMVEAGTVDFDFSLESASPRMQKLMQKNLDIKKLRESINYIITHHPHVIIELQTMTGFPTETE
jgi:acyl transferase domain-containing protein